MTRSFGWLHGYLNTPCRSRHPRRNTGNTAVSFRIGLGEDPKLEELILICEVCLRNVLLSRWPDAEYPTPTLLRKYRGREKEPPPILSRTPCCVPRARGSGCNASGKV